MRITHVMSSPRKRGPILPGRRCHHDSGPTLSFAITTFGGYGSPPEPVIGPAKPDPLAGTTWRGLRLRGNASRALPRLEPAA